MTFYLYLVIITYIDFVFFYNELEFVAICYVIVKYVLAKCLSMMDKSVNKSLSVKMKVVGDDMKTRCTLVKLFYVQLTFIIALKCKYFLLKNTSFIMCIY